MLFRRMLVVFLGAASLSLGLPLAAASAAPAAYSVAGVSAAAGAVAASGAQTGSSNVAALSPGAVPQIRWNPSCAVGTRTTWVLLFEFTLPARGVSHWCFGYTGTWKFPANGTDQATYFCAGNNHGNIKVKWQGQVRTYNFGSGTRITWQPGSATLISLTITGWSGSNTCLV